MAVFVGLDGYNGIKSQEVLNMIANSEPIEIRVGVGAHLKKWHLPKQLLMNNSTFFAAAVDGGFAKQHSKTVTLPEVATNDFEVWVQWLYLGEVRPKEVGPYHKELARLWLLGEMLGCPMFQDVSLGLLAMDINNDDHGMRPEFLAFIWENCAHGSKLRMFVVELFSYDVRVGRFKGNRKSEEAFTLFAEDNGDFAREYTAASIRNGGRERSLKRLYETYASRP